VTFSFVEGGSVLAKPHSHAVQAAEAVRMSDDVAPKIRTLADSAPATRSTTAAVPLSAARVLAVPLPRSRGRRRARPAAGSSPYWSQDLWKTSADAELATLFDTGALVARVGRCRSREGNCAARTRSTRPAWTRGQHGRAAPAVEHAEGIGRRAQRRAGRMLRQDGGSWPGRSARTGSGSVQEFLDYPSLL